MEVWDRLRDAASINKQRPGKTYRIDFEAGRIRGKADGLAAVEQAIYKALLTPRWAFPIYDGQYGSELAELFFSGGASAEYIGAETERLVKEALLPDDRILDVTDIAYELQGDSAYISFIVHTVYGSSDMEVVLIDV